MKLGDLQIDVLSDGTFKLDGGAMFGIVPKPLWSRLTEADEKNRIPLGLNCLLIRGRGRTIVVETGIGGRWSEKLRGIYAIDRPGGGLLGALREQGVAPEDVTDCVLTHLHFDHAGGAVVAGDAGDDEAADLRPAFPEATWHVQADMWSWAREPSPRDAGSFRLDDFAVLEEGDLKLHEGVSSVCDGIELHPIYGHTVGQQMVKIETDEGGLLYPADLVPTSAHLKLPYVMAYDLFPMTTVAEKSEWLERAADEDWHVVFVHDPLRPWVRLAREGDGFVVAEELGRESAESD